MAPVEILNPAGRAPLVLTCEHASCAIPIEHDDLGLSPEALREHIGWDIGAREVTLGLAEEFGASAVLSRVSRLVIDCNRALSDADLIITESHGLRIPGNAAIDAAERDRRIRDFYRPYHEAIHDRLSDRPGAFLFSIHSFTPQLNGRPRRFDAGVLFDEYPDDARRLGEALAAAGLSVRYNEPYSGLDGLIHSARSHGQRHGVRYLELELNNQLLREPHAARAVAARVAAALRPLVADREA